MLKKISVDQLVLGMHIKEFCGSWMDHPFWRTGFVLQSQRDLNAVLESAVKEMWIDSDLGKDIQKDQAPLGEVATEDEFQEDLAKEKAVAAAQVKKVSAGEEFKRAAKICAKSKQAVASMFMEARMGRAINTQNARRMVEEVSASVTRSPGAIISLARLKTADDYTYMHSVAVCALMVSLAQQLGLSEEDVRFAGVAGLMHDMGKAHTPIDILNKPTKLTDAEFEIMKEHPVKGAMLLARAANSDEKIVDVVRHHHEKMDGTGYPDQLKGDKISQLAKMCAICDVYDAITSNRPYKSAWDPAGSLSKMSEMVGHHLDATIFQAFVKSLGIYPMGSMVRLSSGRLGVVIAQSKKSLLTPHVKVFFSTRANTRIPPEIVDLSLMLNEKIIARENPAKWDFLDFDSLWTENVSLP